MLLDTVELLVPVGNHHWAGVAELYNEWTDDEGKVNRDQDSLKSKYDKLVHVQKSTGDPTCPPDARRAKLIFK